MAMDADDTAVSLASASASDANAFWSRVLPVEARLSQAIQLSRHLVDVLPARIAASDSERDYDARIAFHECFLVNVRLLLEFLGVRGDDGRDFRATTLGWQLPTVDRVAFMRLWEIASRHVVHLSLERAPGNVADLTPADDPDVGSIEGLVVIRVQVLELYGRFADDLRVRGHVDAARYATG